MKSRNPIFPYALPEKIDEAEIRELARQMKQGDRSARDRLIECNMRLVMYTVIKFMNCRYDPEELFAIGCIGLIKAVDTYDPDRGWQFSTYASRCIRNEILMALEKVRKNNRVCSLDAKWKNQNGDEMSFADMLGTDPDAMDEAMVRECDVQDMRDLLAGMGERDQRMLTLLYGLDGSEPKGQTDTGREIGLTQSMVSRTERKVLAKMREAMNKAG